MKLTIKSTLGLNASSDEKENCHPVFLLLIYQLKVSWKKKNVIIRRYDETSL